MTLSRGYIIIIIFFNPGTRKTQGIRRQQIYYMVKKKSFVYLFSGKCIFRGDRIRAWFHPHICDSAVKFFVKMKKYTLLNKTNILFTFAIRIFVIIFFFSITSNTVINLVVSIELKWNSNDTYWRDVILMTGFPRILQGYVIMHYNMIVM